MVACLLPDKGSLNVIRRSLMPFGKPVSFLIKSDLIAKPTPASSTARDKSLYSTSTLHTRIEFYSCV